MKTKTKWIIEQAIGVILYFPVLVILLNQDFWTQCLYFYVLYPILWALFCLFIERNNFPNHWKRNSIVRISVVLIFLAASVVYSMNNLIVCEPREFVPPSNEKKLAEPDPGPYLDNAG